MRRARGLAAAGLAMLAAGCVPAAGTPPSAVPRRIVSINPCVDAILVQVADPAQIAGISRYSQDPEATSMPIDQARRFVATAGTAEEVVALAPDLVMAGAHVDPATAAALRRMHIPLLQLGVPATIADNRAQVSQIAAATGHADRGDRLNARIDAAVTAASSAAARAGPPVPALVWLGGLVPGEGTLTSDLLRAAGFRNASADYGLRQWDVLPLELLVARPPAMLFAVGDEVGGGRALDHPVLRPLAARIAVRPFPKRLVNCGGPTIIDAVAVLASARRPRQ